MSHSRSPQSPPLRLLLAAAAVALASSTASAQTWPKDFVTEDIGSSWDRPTCLCYPDHDDNADLFVTEKAGVLSNVRNGIRQVTPVLDLRDEILDNGDRGLLSVQADPEWEENGWIYLLYVVDPNADGNDSEQYSFGRLVRYTTYRDVNGELIADPASRLVLIGATWPEGIPSLHWSHATGDMRFGEDGSLFLATGDGAHYDLTDTGGFDPGGFGTGKFDKSEDIGAYRSLSPTSLAGKILRVDPATGLGLPDNPLYTGNPADNQSRVWAMGLRNPFRMTKRPNSGTPGKLYISDVGWNDYEEINHAKAGGENFGWPCMEGPSVQSSYDNADPYHACDDITIFDRPLWHYHHSSPNKFNMVGQCITGVQVYGGTEYPQKYSGRLFFCEYSSDWIRTVRFVNGLPTEVELFGNNVGNPVHLIEDPENGDLLYIAIGDNAVRRIRYTDVNHPPVIDADVSPTWGAAPLTVNFDASGSSDPEGGALTFLWDFGDGTTSTNAVTSHNYPGNQNYTASLTVTDTGGEAKSWSTLISVGNTPPVITAINSPLDGDFYAAGQLLTFDATAKDAEDDPASIPLTAEWRIDLVHDHHTHPGWLKLSGFHQQWNADSHGSGTYYVVTLTVTDSRGLTASQSLEIYDVAGTPMPHLVELSATSVRLGQPITATAHLHYPGKGEAALWMQFGDGSGYRSRVEHMEDWSVTHTYKAPGVYTLRVQGFGSDDRNLVTQTILVRPLHPAVAIFIPIVAERFLDADMQWELASSVADSLRSAGYEAEIFSWTDQDRLAAWLDTYLDDGIRDYLVCIDAGPSVAYAGEDDGSRAEAWLDKGNGILWTGFNQFSRYILPDGTDTNVGAFQWAADEVLDSAQPQLCSGIVTQQLEPPAVDLPALVAFATKRGIVTSKLGAAWSVDTLYASHGGVPPVSDALVLRNTAGGEFASFHCVADRKSPRAEVLRDFFLTHLYANQPSGPGPFTLNNPPNQSIVAQLTNVPFDWQQTGSETSWLFEAAFDAEFTRPMHQEVVKQPNLVLGNRLRNSTTYYWRVTARNDYGWWTAGPFEFHTSTGTAIQR